MENKIPRRAWILLALVLVLSCCLNACSSPVGGSDSGASNAIYVDSRSIGTHDGKSWESACLTVQEGIDEAAASGKEVWVAKGTYIECLTLRDGVMLYGGFAGSETALSQRNWTANSTVLDGNNRNTVVQYTGVHTKAACIDGFTIQNGNGRNNGHGGGGGIYCDSDLMGYLTIANDIIMNNSASFGGGIYFSFSSGLIENSVISSNTSSGLPSHSGGGIYAGFSSSPAIIGNTIEDNYAANGGGIYLTGSWGTISNNFVRNNHGDGIRCELSSIMRVQIANNVISGNEAQGLDFYNVKPRAYSNTICSNAEQGIDTYGNSSSIIANNIVAFNGSGGIRNDDTPAPVSSHNCVYGNTNYDYQGMAAGTGDISINPGLAADGYHLGISSPCLGSGDNGYVLQDWLDIDGQPRIHGTTVDIGADEDQL